MHEWRSAVIDLFDVIDGDGSWLHRFVFLCVVNTFSALL